jgi:hypothetical protein
VRAIKRKVRTRDQDSVEESTREPVKLSRG